MKESIDASLSAQESCLKFAELASDHRAVIQTFDPRWMTTEQVQGVFAEFAHLLTQFEEHERRTCSVVQRTMIEMAKHQSQLKQ